MHPIVEQFLLHLLLRSRLTSIFRRLTIYRRIQLHDHATSEVFYTQQSVFLYIYSCQSCYQWKKINLPEEFIYFREKLLMRNDPKSTEAILVSSSNSCNKPNTVNSFGSIKQLTAGLFAPFTTDLALSPGTFTPRRVPLMSALLALTVLAAGTALPNGAQAAVQGMVTDLPASVELTENIEVPFTASAPSGICGAWSEAPGVYVTDAGEGKFVLELNSVRVPLGRSNATVSLSACDGESSDVNLEVNLPFRLSVARILAPWAEDSWLRTLNIEAEAGAQEPVTISVLKNNKTVKTFAPVNSKQDLSFKPSKKQASSGQWVVRAKSSGQVVDVPFTLARKWAPLDGTEARSFPRCSTLTWSYSAEGAPTRSKGILTDIQDALRQTGDVTGTRFVQVEKGQKADLVIEWKNLGKHGPAGMGGYNYTQSNDESTYTGSVDLNLESSWVGEPGFKADRYGVPGRGHLLLHEIGHAMGLGHVHDKGTLMNPGAFPGSPTGFTAGDLEGFNYLYQPQSCASS